MFVRQVFRTAQPIKHSIRRYATEEPPPPSHRGLFAFFGVVLAGSVGAGVIITRRNDARAAVRKSSTLKTEAKKAFTGGEQGFIDLRLDRVENINHNTKRFRYALPEPDMVSGLQIASALLTKYQGPGMEKPVIRPYTPVSDEGERGYLDLVVKQYPNGPMSEHIHAMAPPQTLAFKGPIPKYAYKPNMHSHVALVAGGTGITPMYQLVRGIFANPQDKTKVTLVFGNVSEEDILLKKEFDELENTYPQRFRAFYVLNKPPEGWTQGKGHITKELLQTVLPGKEEKDAKVFVCGPPGLYQAISGGKKSPSDQGELGGVLKELGYEKEQVFKF